jgi:hypothetical protein
MCGRVQLVVPILDAYASGIDEAQKAVKAGKKAAN